MDFKALPKVLQSELLSYLTPGELIGSLSHANHAFRVAVSIFITHSRDYRELYLGILPPTRTSFNNLPKLLILADFKHPKILQFAVTYTDGGMFQMSKTYWAQHMFEYTGAIYTSGEVVKNVTVCGTLLGTYCAYQFSENYHSDLSCLHDRAMFWIVPAKYLECWVATDSFLKDTPPKIGASFLKEEIKAWSTSRYPMHKQEILHEGGMTYRVKVSESETFALVTHVGIARPAYATCPVRTLMIFTKLGTSSVDLRRWYDITTQEEILTCPDLPPISHSETLNGYSYVEFAATKGPLLWVQFTAYQHTQIEIALARRRVMKHAEVLLLDIEDRRAEYGTIESGIDITYIVFAGKVLPTEFTELLG